MCRSALLVPASKQAHIKKKKKKKKGFKWNQKHPSLNGHKNTTCCETCLIGLNLPAKRQPLFNKIVARVKDCTFSTEISTHGNMATTSLPDDEARRKTMFWKIIICCRPPTQIQWQPFTFLTSLTIYDCSSSKTSPMCSLLCVSLQALKIQGDAYKMSHSPLNTKAVQKFGFEEETASSVALDRLSVHWFLFLTLRNYQHQKSH